MEEEEDHGRGGGGVRVAWCVRGGKDGASVIESSGIRFEVFFFFFFQCSVVIFHFPRPSTCTAALPKSKEEQNRKATRKATRGTKCCRQHTTKSHFVENLS